MKRRRSLLFGLGIMTVLSVTVPVSAAEIQKDKAETVGTVEEQGQETEAKVQTEENVQPEETQETAEDKEDTEGTEEQDNTETQGKPTYEVKEENGDKVYQVKNGDGTEAHSTGAFELEFEGIEGKHIYFPRKDVKFNL